MALPPTIPCPAVPTFEQLRSPEGATALERFWPFKQPWPPFFLGSGRGPCLRRAVRRGALLRRREVRAQPVELDLRRIDGLHPRHALALQLFPQPVQLHARRGIDALPKQAARAVGTSLLKSGYGS